MSASRWSLKIVKQLASKGDLVLSQTKAVAFFSSETEAYETARRTIANLSSLDYSHTVQQRDEADVYGVVIGGSGWYLKISVQTGSLLLVISLHPAKAPIRTKKGMVTP